MRARSIVIIGLVVVMLAGVLLQGQGALEIRAASTTAVSGWQQTGAPGGSAIWIAPAGGLTSADIARAEPRTPSEGGAAVGVVFTAEGAQKMSALSAAQSGKPIAMLLDGKVIWAPTVRGTIEKEAVLTGLTQAQFDRLLTTLKR